MEGACNAGLDGQGGFFLREMFGQAISGIHQSDPGDNGFHLLVLSQVNALTEIGQGGQNFLPGGSNQGNIHAANLGFSGEMAIILLCLNFAPLRKIMVYLTRVEHFNAAHKLFNPGWSREKNDEVFGKCANENWHGHNFELFVTVRGLPDPGTGFIVDAKLLSKIIRDSIIEKLDHRNLNLDVDFMAGKMCSIENLVLGIWNELKPLIPAGVELHCIELVETPRIFVEYYG